MMSTAAIRLNKDGDVRLRIGRSSRTLTAAEWCDLVASVSYLGYTQGRADEIRNFHQPDTTFGPSVTGSLETAPADEEESTDPTP